MLLRTHGFPFVFCIQVACESSHATTFAVQYAAAACPFCTAPVAFFEFEATMPHGTWTLLVLVVSVCIYGARLHAQDRLDWIPPRNNVEAYFLPVRPVRQKTSMLGSVPEDPSPPDREVAVSTCEPRAASPHESGERVLGARTSEF